MRHAYLTVTQALELVPAMTDLDETERKRLEARIKRWDKNK